MNPFIKITDDMNITFIPHFAYLENFQHIHHLNDSSPLE